LALQELKNSQVKNKIMTKSTLETLIKKALKEAKLNEEVNWFYDENGCHCLLSNGHQVGQDCDEANCATCCKWKESETPTRTTTTASKSKQLKLKEAEVTAGESNTNFNLKVDVSNKQSETKLGIRIQLEPKEGFLEPDLKDKLEIAVSKKLNNALEQFDMQVSKDTDVPDPTVIGFFIPLSQIKNMIVKSLGGDKGTQSPTPPSPSGVPSPTTAPLPPTSSVKDDVEEMINEELLKEMRVRELKEISKTVRKEDFYEFINKGQNIIRTLEEAGMDNGKKYLEYLVKHNIM